ncbi:19994_t:CDS:1, partial [Gigaspora margarita]
LYGIILAYVATSVTFDDTNHSRMVNSQYEDQLRSIKSGLFEILSDNEFYIYTFDMMDSEFINKPSV